MGIHLNWLLELRTHWHVTRAILCSVVIVVAIALAFRVFLRTARKPLADRFGFKLFLWVVSSWLIGMNINGLIRGFETYSRTGNFVFAGFEELGGLLASLVALLFFCRKEKISYVEVLDGYLLAVLVFLSVSSFACFFIGCCDGLPTQVSWAIAGRPPLPGTTQQYFHPTALYAVLGYGLIYGLTRRAFSQAEEGRRAFFVLSAIFLFRMSLQLYKQNHATALRVLGLDDLQMTALVVWVVGSGSLLVKQIKSLRVAAPLRQERGYTLVEIVFVIMILGILYKVSTSSMGDHQEAQKFEETRARLEAIKTAIIGDEKLRADGKRTHFGYHGDMGSLPATLADLVTIGVQPAWTYSTWHRIGWGWRGPYLTQGSTGSITYTKDAWGNTIYYDTSLPATIRSYGSDNAASGSGYATDLVLSIPSTQLRGNVRLHVTDRGESVSGVFLGWVYYPTNGAVGISGISVLNSYGDLSISDVPFGVRSLFASWGGLLPIVVDRPETIVGPIDLSGKTRTVTFTAGTRKRGSSANIVQATLASNHEKDLVVSSIEVASWAGPNNIVRFGLNGRSQTVSIPKATGNLGTPQTITANFVFYAKQSVNIFEVEFDSDATGLVLLPNIYFRYSNEENIDTVSIS